MISIDFDGVLNNILFKWIDYINDKHNTTYTIEDVIEYNDKILIGNYEYIKDQNLYDNIELLDGAKDFVEELKKIDDVQIVTHTYAESLNSKKIFLDKHFSGIPVIHTTTDKDIVKNTILIDDKLENIERHVNELNSTGIVYSYNNMYNYNKTDSIIRLTNYEDILNFIKQIK